MKKSIAAATIAASTIGGIAAGATMFGPGIAGAQDEAQTQTHSTFAERVSEALQPLVDAGTINESQRDAVVDQLESSRPEPGERDHGRGRHGPGRAVLGGEVAEILGLDRAEIAEALRSGESLADLAIANEVDPQDLVDAIVAAAETRVNGAVESGRIDADQAADILADAAQRAEDIVNGEIEFGGRGFRGPGGPDGSGGPVPDGDNVPATA